MWLIFHQLFGLAGKQKGITTCSQVYVPTAKALDLKPNVVTFACLVGAYTTAELEDILAVYNEMQELRILPNKIFAETYLVTVLQKPKQERWTEQKAVVEIRKRSPERIAAASQAIADFQAAGISLTSLSKRICRALAKL